MTTGEKGASGPPAVATVASLNVHRRNDALYLLARDYGNPLTPYDVCKTQVLADVFQIIETGNVIFGGRLYAMPFGPVVKQTLDDCAYWARAALMYTMLARKFPFEQLPLQPTGWTGAHNQVALFRASPEYERRDVASWDWFSDQEQANVTRAYEKVVGMGSLSSQSQRYFHEPVSAIGYAYDVAIQPFAKPFMSRVDMNWYHVLDGAERVEKTDCSYARTMLGLRTQG